MIWKKSKYSLFLDEMKKTLYSIFKESINEQRKLFTFDTDGYMCVNKLTLSIDLVFRISKKLNELFLEDKLVDLESSYIPYHYVHRYNEITRMCDKIINEVNNEQSMYKRAKIYYDYTHYKGCLQNIVTCDEYNLICTYIKAMIYGNKRSTLRLLLDKLTKDDIMLINSSVISNIFDHMDDLYTRIQLPESLKINIGRYYERYKNETDINDYKYYYMFITPDYFNDSLPRLIKEFNKRYAFVFALR